MTTPIQIQEWNVYVGLILVGIFSGIGNAIGQYLVSKYIKPNLEKTHRTIKRKINKIGEIKVK